MCQQVCKWFHQVSCEQHEESFEAVGDAVGQPVESQQTIFTLRFAPVEELRDRRTDTQLSPHGGKLGRRLNPRHGGVTLKKSGLNVTSDSFITMAIRQSITQPSTCAVFSRSP